MEIMLVLIFFLCACAGGTILGSMDVEDKMKYECVENEKGTNENYTLREIAKKCLDLTEDEINCLPAIDNPLRTERKMATTISIFQCFPNIEENVRLTLLHDLELWFNIEESQKLVAAEYNALVDEEKIILWEVRGSLLFDETKKNVPNMNKLAEVYQESWKHLVAYALAVHQYFMASDKVNKEINVEFYELMNDADKAIVKNIILLV